MQFDTVQMILQLIYGGAVEVPAKQMRTFVKAAKFLKLQGFANVDTTLSIDDIRGADQIPQEKYTIRLKRMDDDQINMAMQVSNERHTEPVDANLNPSIMTNGEINGGCSSSQSGTSDGSSSGSSRNASASPEIANIGQDELCKANGFPLLSSSDSDDDAG